MLCSASSTLSSTSASAPRRSSQSSSRLRSPSLTSGALSMEAVVSVSVRRRPVVAEMSSFSPSTQPRSTRIRSAMPRKLGTAPRAVDGDESPPTVSLRTRRAPWSSRRGGRASTSVTVYGVHGSITSASWPARSSTEPDREPQSVTVTDAVVGADEQVGARHRRVRRHRAQHGAFGDARRLDVGRATDARRRRRRRPRRRRRSRSCRPAGGGRVARRGRRRRCDSGRRSSGEIVVSAVIRAGPVMPIESSIQSPPVTERSSETPSAGATDAAGAPAGPGRARAAARGVGRRRGHGAGRPARRGPAGTRRRARCRRSSLVPSSAVGAGGHRGRLDGRTVLHPRARVASRQHRQRRCVGAHLDVAEHDDVQPVVTT